VAIEEESIVYQNELKALDIEMKQTMAEIEELKQMQIAQVEANTESSLSSITTVVEGESGTVTVKGVIGSVAGDAAGPIGWGYMLYQIMYPPNSRVYDGEHWMYKWEFDQKHPWPPWVRTLSAKASHYAGYLWDLSPINPMFGSNLGSYVAKNSRNFLDNLLMGNKVPRW
jgi:hypothetical protein